MVAIPSKTSFESFNFPYFPIVSNPLIPQDLEMWRSLTLHKYNIPNLKTKHKVKIAFIDGKFERSDLLQVKNPLFNQQELDFSEHGTNVGSLIIAVNPNIELFSYGIFTKKKQTINELIKNESLAIDNAIINKVKLINISMEGPKFSQIEFNALKRAEKAGIIVVVAAGNNRMLLNKQNCNSYPACNSLKLKNIIVVGNMNDDNLIATQSNFGDLVDLFFYGEDIIALAPKKGMNYNSGTSFAAPLITGLISQLIGQADKPFTIQQIKSRIKQNTMNYNNNNTKIWNHQETLRKLSSYEKNLL
jgi:hypothetical protein